MAPEISRSFATRSVGWAPSDSHLAGVVVTQDLDETTVARRASISRNNAILRLLLLADPGEAQLDCHV
jgi:hypothetical protein